MQCLLLKKALIKAKMSLRSVEQMESRRLINGLEEEITEVNTTE